MTQQEIQKTTDDAANMASAENEPLIRLFGELVRAQSRQTELIEFYGDVYYSEMIAKRGL